MSALSTDTIAVEFFDGSVLRYEPFGTSAQVVLISANGRVEAGIKTNAKAAWADFVKRAVRIHRTTDPIDQNHFDQVILGRVADEHDWDRGRYLQTAQTGGWTSFLVPRGLIALEKIGYRLVLETDHTREIRSILAQDLKFIGGDITLIGAFADRERFVLLDGFSLDHDEHSTTAQRLADLRETLGRVPSIVFAPHAPAEDLAFTPSSEIDVIVRRLADPYTSMPQHIFESRFSTPADPEHTATSVPRDPDSPFISPPR